MKIIHFTYAELADLAKRVDSCLELIRIAEGLKQLSEPHGTIDLKFFNKMAHIRLRQLIHISDGEID